MDENQNRPLPVAPQAPLIAQEPPAPTPLTHEETKQVLKAAIWDSNEVLAEATTVLTIFTDTMCIDRTMLTVTKRSFFKSAEVMSIRIEDVLNVTATVGPFFGSIKIVSRVLNTEKPFHIGLFWRKDAMRMKRILQGYVIALQGKIDCSSLSTHELANMLDKLGEDVHTAA